MSVLEAELRGRSSSGDADSGALIESRCAVVALLGAVVVGSLALFAASTAVGRTEASSLNGSFEWSSKTSATAAAPAKAVHDLPSIFRSPAKLPLRTSNRRCQPPSSLCVIVAAARNGCAVAFSGPASFRRRARTTSTRGHSAGAVHSSSMGSRGWAEASNGEHMPSNENSHGAGLIRIGAELRGSADRDVIDVDRGGRGQQSVG